jgi:hypothetical protein
MADGKLVRYVVVFHHCKSTLSARFHYTKIVNFLEPKP